MKKFALIILLILGAVAAYIGWQIFGPTINQPSVKYVYIPTGAIYADVKNILLEQDVIHSSFYFDKLAKQAKYPNNIKPGRYQIKSGQSVYSLVKMLKSGNQAPVKLVINKLRTKEDFASKISQNFECDSLAIIQFLNNNDSLQTFNVDTNTAITAVIPNTYLLNWNSSFKKIFTKLHNEQQIFWNNERSQKAAANNLTPTQVYIIASIVEEETNKAEDKPLVASVYTNRLAQGQKLEADPTVKFAMQNFGLKRILYVHLKYESPYNTYLHNGLPPGPICTPSTKTIDAVLDAPKTDYIFFVAKPSLNGYSNFATTYAQHQIFAKQYQQALDSLIRSRQ